MEDGPLMQWGMTDFMKSSKELRVMTLVTSIAVATAEAMVRG